MLPRVVGPQSGNEGIIFVHVPRVTGVGFLCLYINMGFCGPFSEYR